MVRTSWRRFARLRLCLRAMLLLGISATAAAGDEIPLASQSWDTLFQWSGKPSSEPAPPRRSQPLASDRPDFTEASSTVGRGIVQLEMGYTYIFDEEAGIAMRQHSYPEALWRIGLLADWLELRIAYNHAKLNMNQGPLPLANFSGAEDLYLGAKLALTPQQGWLPEMALVPQMTVPTGASTLTAGCVLPGVNWLYGWDVNDFLSTAGSTQINQSIDGSGDCYTELAQSWTIGYHLTDKLGAYTEWFGLFPSGAVDVGPMHYFDCGLTFQVNNDWQFDVRYGVGLNEAANDYFAGTGMVYRF